MKELTELELQCLKHVALDILKEVDRVCRKNGIKYSIAYGTLLGAVRHKGYIPWDDDIDIMMCRDEYEKFRKIVAGELRDDYYFVDVKSHQDYGFFFSKVMRKETVMKEESISRNKAPSGIFIDIFVYDILANQQTKLEKQYKKAQRLKKICICRSKYYFGQTNIRYIIYKMLGLVYRIMPKKWIIDAYTQNARQYENDNTCEMYGHLSGLCLKQEMLPRDIFSQYTTLSFEGFEAMAVAEYEYVLEKRYGDYMKLPPKEYQMPHHYVEKIDFGAIDGIGR